MRMIVIKQGTNLQALSTRLLAGGAGKEGALQSLQRLNPHVEDFAKIEAGTVLLVPDLPATRDGESTSISGEAFAVFREQVSEAVDAAVARVRSGYEALAAQRKDVTALLKTAAVKRMLEAEPDLRKQLDATTELFKQDQQRAKEAEKTLETLQEANHELRALAKLVG